MMNELMILQIFSIIKSIKKRFQTFISRYDTLWIVAELAKHQMSEHRFSFKTIHHNL